MAEESCPRNSTAKGLRKQARAKSNAGVQACLSCLFGSKASLTIPAVVLLCSCGFGVPEIQEFWGTPADASTRVAQISGQVKCELTNAVRAIFKEDEDIHRLTGRPRQFDFLETWAAQAN